MLRQWLKAFPYMLLSLVVAVCMGVAEVRLFLTMGYMIDASLKGATELFGEHIGVLMQTVLAFIPLSVLHSFTFSLYRKKANIKMKTYYLRGIFAKNISEFSRDNNAKYVSGLTNDFNTIETNLVDGVYTVCRAVISVGVGIWMVIGGLSMNETEGFISSGGSLMFILLIGVLVFNFIITRLVSKPINRHTKERSGLFEGYTVYIKEVVSAFHIVKSNNLQEHVKASFSEKSTDLQQKGYIINKLLSYTQALQNGSMQASMYICLLICAFVVVARGMNVASAFILVQGGQAVLWPIINIAQWVPIVFSVKELIKKMEESLENVDKHKESLNFEGLQKGITLNNVSYAYDEYQSVLDGVNLEMKKGCKYLFIGPSGGGKSTLLKLLRKYFNPTEGEILIDGKNLKDIKKEDFYNSVANVEQQVFIFEDTLRHNITMYKDYTQEEIDDAIKKAGLLEFVSNLPEGLDTMIYDNGSNVSGGERSRIVIARGLLRKASIIFLDEAFAALDMKRAKEIEASILALEGVTVINVSHVVFEENKCMYDQVLTVKNRRVKSGFLKLYA